MKFLKNYFQYKESIGNPFDVSESLNVWQDSLLTSIGAQEMDIFETLNMNREDFNNNIDIDFFSDNNEFIDALSSIGLKKSNVELSDDYETFINKPCKFMFIYNIDSNELENPKYLLFQSWNDTLDKWEDCRFYQVNGDVKKFYDKLSSHTIEIVDGDKKYIYVTSNGNDWELQNLDSSSEKYKRFFTKDELYKILSVPDIKFEVL